MTVIREKYQGVIIRRSVNSMDCYGKPISGLPLYKENICMLKMYKHEYAALDTLATNELDDESYSREFSSEVSNGLCFTRR